MSGVLNTLAGATPNRKIVKICVDGAAQAEWDMCLDEAETLVAVKEESLAAEKTTELIDRMETIRERIINSEVSFEIEQMPWTKRITLQAEHPPRGGNFVDQLRGYNAITFSPMIIQKSCVSVTGVDGDRVTDIPVTVWEKLLGNDDTPGTLNLKQVDTLLDAATSVNDRDTAVPPSARSLLQSPDSGASLAQPSPGKSARSASGAGNRRTSQRSSTAKKAAAKKTASSGT